MRRKLFFIFVFFIFTVRYIYSESPSCEISNIEPIKKNERILILAPHPDDETIGCAGVIQQALKTGASLRIAYLTNGDHNQVAFIVYEKRLTFRTGEFIYMGQVRRQEAIKAMRLLGINEKNLIFLGYPDFGTFTIFSRYWQDTQPFKSLLTRISAVPYKENLSFGAPYKGESILNDLKKVLLDYKPNKIFVSHPADTNVDHKAFYLFLQIALRDLDKDIPKPKIYVYLIHCTGWPLPRHYHPQLNLEPPQKFRNSQIDWSELKLSPEEVNKKYQAILCYKSQTQSSAFYLLSFARKNELFGDYPEVELKKQILTKDEEILFNGSSDMFADLDSSASNKATATATEQIKEDRGRVSYAFVDDSILINVEKKNDLNRSFSIILYLFGYSPQVPFSQMPKVRIITKYNKFKVFDGSKKVNPEGVVLKLNDKGLILKVPLKILGEPNFILTSIKAYVGVGILPVDLMGFRKIDIKL